MNRRLVVFIIIISIALIGGTLFGYFFGQRQ